MNIYIPYSLERDIFKGEELKFAIRSIEKYLSGWENIILIGTAPDWFNGMVIPANDIPNKKETSILKKMCKVNDRVFVRWDDDHFLLKPLKVEDIKDWHSGYLTQHLENGKFSARYRVALMNTVEEYHYGYYYDIHTPCIFCSAHLDILQLNWDSEYCLKSMYFNYILDPRNEFMEDLKLNNWLSKEEIRAKIEGRIFFSTGTLFEPVREVLNELYPKPSKFERV